MWITLLLVSYLYCETLNCKLSWNDCLKKIKLEIYSSKQFPNRDWKRFLFFNRNQSIKWCVFELEVSPNQIRKQQKYWTIFSDNSWGTGNRATTHFLGSNDKFINHLGENAYHSLHKSCVLAIGSHKYCFVVCLDF